MMIHWSFLFRQMAMYPRQSVMVFVSVMFSLTTLTGVNGFSRSIQQALTADARALHAADVIVRSNFPVSPPTDNRISQLETDGVVRSARVYEFYSMARTVTDSGSLLSQIKVVEPGYPFYGQILLQSGRRFQDVLTGNAAIVDPAVLDRMSCQLGDTIRLGGAELIIRDILIHEPDRPVAFFSLGPRIFVSAGQLAAMDLVRPGGRVQYKHLIAVKSSENLANVVADITAVAAGQPEQVETFQTARSPIRRFLNNLLFFLGLIGMFILILSGMAIQSAVSAYIQDQEHTIAVIASIGADRRFILTHYLIMIGFLGMLGTIAGFATGWGLQIAGASLIPGLVVEKTAILTSFGFLIEALSIGFIVVGCFAFTPLLQIRHLKPARIFQKDRTPVARNLIDYTGYGISSLVIMLFFFMKLDDRQTVLQIAGGMTAWVILAAFLSAAALYGIKKLRTRFLAVRLGLKSLFRAGNSSVAVMTTLTVSFSVILAVILIENNLNASFITAYPKDSPNLFFIDIQPDQKAGVKAALGEDIQFYPIIRARIQAINGVPIDRRKESDKKGDNLARSFNLTYRNTLLSDEIIQKGGQLFDANGSDLQVSILDTAAEIHPMAIGDRITFQIQGVPVEARISSIRTRISGAIQPFFYFVFPESRMKDMPQTLFTAIRASNEDISSIQQRISVQFPNISIIDVTATLTRMEQLLGRLSTAIRFLMLFSVSAGLLLLINSIWSTRFARIQETVYYKISGASASFLIEMITFENGFLGCVSAIFGLILAQAAGWMVCRNLLDISYRFFWIPCILMMLMMIVLTTAIGLMSSRAIVQHKPVDFLRDAT
ncbi:MAG: ABC transporter permease [Desulfatirhabdiaceae bacterium]